MVLDNIMTHKKIPKSNLNHSNFDKIILLWQGAFVFSSIFKVTRGYPSNLSKLVLLLKMSVLFKMSMLLVEMTT